MMTKKILILDDDPGHQLLVSKLLHRSFVCDTILTSTLAEAKEKIQQHQFDVITLDGSVFHDEFGFQLIPAIRELQKPYCKIIMISSLQKYINSGLNVGDEYNSKQIFHADYGFLKQEIITCEGKVSFTERFEVILCKCDTHNST
jgi:CheY-like chemotaxis protein